MPTNVPPQYREAEQRLREATTPDEKLAILEEMLRILPKHKATDKLQADLKAKISKIRKMPEKKGPRSGPSHMISREGAGQVVLVGPPNAGKSALVDRLTHATPEVAEYPFTTREPVPGMMPFEDIAFQLIDTPPLSREHVEPWVYDLVRRADLVWVVVSGDNSEEGLTLTRTMLEEKKILLHAPGTPIPEDDSGFVTRKPALLLVTGADQPDAAENLEILQELTEIPWPLYSVSGTGGQGLEALGLACYQALDLIRVYTKEPGKPADREKPFALDRGANVETLALAIHRDIAETMKFARIWGKDVFDGQQVQKEHVLSDGDVVEIHAV